MFGMGMPEILLILAIALIVLGPKKLPEIAKSLGRGIAEFKRATQDFKQSMEVDNDIQDAKKTLKGMKSDIEQSVRDTVAQGAASVNDDEDVDEDDEEAVPEEDLEHTSENDVTEAPKEAAEEIAQQQAEQKEPSKDV